MNSRLCGVVCAQALVEVGVVKARIPEAQLVNQSRREDVRVREHRAVSAVVLGGSSIQRTRARVEILAPRVGVAHEE